MNMGDGFNTFELSSERGPVPMAMSLGTAYPNPFNPVTSFEYNIPVDGMVKVAVYDISGRLIKELQNTNMQAGYHSIAWNATMYSSGIYFVRLHAGSFHHAQKLMLVK